MPTAGRITYQVAFMAKMLKIDYINFNYKH